MAKVKSAGLRNFVGKLGGSVYYMNKGQNVARELAAEVSNPRTPAQMRQRMKWANIVNVFKANKHWMGKLSFENKPQNWSYYNAFMSANINNEPVYVTKDFAEHGSVILAPYTMTKGSLPHISYAYAVSVSGLETNIVMHENPDMTTIGSWSEEILNNNPEWRTGDQLSIVLMYHDRLYRPIVDAIEIIIDPDDNTSLTNIQCRFATLAEILTVDDDRLCIRMHIGTSNENAAACVVHSRTTGGKTYVSTQAFELSFDALYTFRQHGTNEAFNYAVESYGLGSEYFLATEEIIDGYVQDIRSVIYAGTRASEWSDITWIQATMPSTLTIIMNKPFTGTVSLTVGGVSLSASILGRMVTAPVTPSNATAISNASAANQNIVVTIATDRYVWS